MTVLILFPLKSNPIFCQVGQTQKVLLKKRLGSWTGGGGGKCFWNPAIAQSTPWRGYSSGRVPRLTPVDTAPPKHRNHGRERNPPHHLILFCRLWVLVLTEERENQRRRNVMRRARCTPGKVCGVRSARGLWSGLAGDELVALAILRVQWWKQWMVYIGLWENRDGKGDGRSRLLSLKAASKRGSELSKERTSVGLLPNSSLRLTFSSVKWVSTTNLKVLWWH